MAFHPVELRRALTVASKTSAFTWRCRVALQSCSDLGSCTVFTYLLFVPVTCNTRTVQKHQPKQDARKLRLRDLKKKKLLRVATVKTRHS